MAVFRRPYQTSFPPRRYQRRYRPAYSDNSSQALFWLGLVAAVVAVGVSAVTKIAPSLDWLAMVLIGLLAAGFLVGVGYGIWRLWKRSRHQAYLNLKLEEIDQLSGFEFEKYLAALLTELGYQNVRRTPDAYDHGADLIFESEGVKYAAQAKRSSSRVELKALFEGAGGRDYYQGNKVVVITNNYFTEPAKRHARQTGYWLVDRDGLKEWLGRLNTSKNSPSSS